MISFGPREMDRHKFIMWVIEKIRPDATYFPFDEKYSLEVNKVIYANRIGLTIKDLIEKDAI